MICQARGKSEFEGTVVHETISQLRMVIEISREAKLTTSILIDGNAGSSPY